MKPMTGWTGALIGAALLCVSPAKANTYSVVFDGAVFDVNATITTENTVNAVGGYDITAIVGNVNGPTGTITGLVNNDNRPYANTLYAVGVGWIFDNVLYKAPAPPFSNPGVLFQYGSGLYANLYSVVTDLATTFYLSVSNNTYGLWNPGDPGTLVVTQIGSDAPSQTPLPGTLLLLGSVLSTGALIFRRRKASKTALRTA